MATINKKLIHFGKLSDFKTRLAAGDILERSIVCIKDAKMIWTHGEYYGDLSDCLLKTAQQLSDEEINQIKSNLSITDTDTTYTFAGGTNKFTVTPSGGSAQTVNVTPSIANNVTYSGTLTSGQVAVLDGTAG